MESAERTELKRAKQRIYHKTWRERNREAIREYQRSYTLAWYHKNKIRLVANLLLRAAKHRAKRDGVEFTISLKDFTIPDLCPLLDIPLKKNEGKQCPHSPTLDRKDNLRGYIPGNVWVISHRANCAKSDLSADELILIGTKLKHALESAQRQP